MNASPADQSSPEASHAPTLLHRAAHTPALSGSRDESGRWLPRQQSLAKLADPDTAPNLDGDWLLWPIPYEPITSDGQ